MKAPATGTYDPVYGMYLAELPDQDLISILNAQAAALATMIAGMTEAVGVSSYAAGKWTAKQVLGHIVDSERIFAYRALCIARSESQPLPGFDENNYAANSHADQRSLASLGADFAAARAATLALVRSLEPHTLDLPGNANGKRLTPRACLFVLAGHAEHHLKILNQRYLKA
jgi:xanthine/CO dehydrogenase XdhC/CoxF family maturation factor